MGIDTKVPTVKRTFLVVDKLDALWIRFPRLEKDKPRKGWRNTGKFWECIVKCPEATPAKKAAAIYVASQSVRAVATPRESKEWIFKDADGSWNRTNQSEAINVLRAKKFKSPPAVLGDLRLNEYSIVFRPFEPEYLPGRKWNPGAPQFACVPQEGKHPTWDLMWNHLGESLEDGIDATCRELGIHSGDHYLQLWVKSILTNPSQLLPYLFFFSAGGNTGKSSFGHSLPYLIKNGVDEITPESLLGQFTSELESKVVCCLEEVDLNRGHAYAKLKAVMTSPFVNIRRMRTDPYPVRNHNHFVHTAQNPDFVPVENEDTRIVFGEVSPLEKLIDAHEFRPRLEAEAPAMLHRLLTMPMSKPRGRFWLPVLNTAIKEVILAGQYETGLTPAELGVKEFIAKKMNVHKNEAGFFTPQEQVWAAYVTFIQERKTPEGEQPLPQITRNGFLPTIAKKLFHPVTSRQRKVGNDKVRCYTNLTFKEQQ